MKRILLIAVTAICVNNLIAQYKSNLLSCPKAGNLSAIDLTDHSATLTWNGIEDAQSYNVQYRIPGSDVWKTAAAAVVDTFVTVDHLLAYTEYEWRVSCNCSSKLSGYSSSNFVTFIPPDICPGIYDTIDNNTFSTAVNIPFNVDINGTINNPADKDFYKIRVFTAGSFDLILMNLPKNFDLRLFNSSHELIDSSVNDDINAESISANITPGTYFIEVYKAKDESCDSANCYILNATFRSSIVARGLCESSYDTDNNNSVAGAVTIPFNTDITGSISYGADKDFYKIKDLAANTLVITLNNLSERCYVYLYDSSSNLLDSEVSENGSVNISAKNSFKSYYLCIASDTSVADVSAGCYTLRVVCALSSLQAQHTDAVKQQQPISISPNPASNYLRINAGNNTGGNNIVIITNMYGQVLLQSRLKTDGDLVNISRLNSGVYMVSVYSTKGAILYTGKLVKQ